MNAAGCGSRRVPARGWIAVWLLSLFIGGGMFAAQAAGTPAQVISPAQGSTFTDATVTFTWDAGTGVNFYALWIGNAPRTFDLFAWAGRTLSRTARLPADGRRIYVTLWSWLDGTWQGIDYDYTAFTAPPPVKAQLLSPADGSTFTNATVTFTWDAGTGVNLYALWVGSKADSFDLYARLETGLSRTVTLPVDGRAIYVTLWSWMNGKWEKNSYTFTAFTGPPPVAAQMVSPTDGSTFTNRMVTFTWDGGIGVSHIALWIGSTAKSFDLYVGLERGLSRTVRLPVDGRPIYVTLWSWINGKWESHAYTYTAYTQPGLVKAKITSPTNGSNLTSTSLDLTWDAGEGVTRYALWVGSRPMWFDLYFGVETGFSRTVTVPADGRTIYVTLWSFLDGHWQSNSYTFTAPQAVKAQMTDPVGGQILPGGTVTFNWNAGTGVSQYALWVGSKPSSYDLFAGLNTTRSSTLYLPQDGRPLYVTLWSLINGKWESNGYLYKAFTSGLTLFGYGINDWFFDGRSLILLPGWLNGGSSTINLAGTLSRIAGSLENTIGGASTLQLANVAGTLRAVGSTLTTVGLADVGLVTSNNVATFLATNATLRFATNTFALAGATNTLSGAATVYVSASNITNGGIILVNSGSVATGSGTLTLATNGVLCISTNTLNIVGSGSNVITGGITIGTAATINLSATNSGGAVLILNR